MLRILLVGLGGCLGALARYGCSHWAAQRYPGLPAGTTLVNVAGCLALGAVLGWRDGPLDGLRLFFVVGFLGSFTTFATFGAEAVELLRSGDLRTLGLYAAGNLVLGLGAFELGRRVTGGL